MHLLFFANVAAWMGNSPLRPLSPQNFSCSGKLLIILAFLSGLVETTANLYFRLAIKNVKLLNSPAKFKALIFSDLTSENPFFCLLFSVSRFLSPCFPSPVSSVSRLLSHVSCLTSSFSHLLSHVSCVTSPISRLLYPVCLTSPVSFLSSPELSVLQIQYNSVLRSRNYLCLSPAPLLYIFSAPAPAPVLFCHFTISNTSQWRFFFILASSKLT